MPGLVIYKIVNLINNKFYIGSTADERKRWDHHRHKLNKGVHANQHLQKAWKLYGADAFAFVIIAQAANKENLQMLEQQIINDSNCCNPDIGYNICKSVTNSRLGLKSTPEHIAKIVKANTGKIRSPEHCAKLSLARKGTKLTEEQKQVKRNYRHTPEALIKIKANSGKLHSEKTKAKLKLDAQARAKAKKDKIFEGMMIWQG